MKRITTTFFICLLLGITSLHAERDNYTQRTPEKQPEFITGFRYLPPGVECFADMFKYKVIDFPGFSTQDTLYFKKYTRPIKGYTVTHMSCALKKGTKNSLSVVKGADMRKYVRKTEHTGLTVWITGEFRVETPSPPILLNI